eukprot:3315880-Prymnesium_polylepis.1
MAMSVAARRPVKRRRLLSIVGETVYNTWPRLDTIGYKTQMGRSPRTTFFSFVDKAPALSDPGGAPRRAA